MDELAGLLHFEPQQEGQLCYLPLGIWEPDRPTALELTTTPPNVPQNTNLPGCCSSGRPPHERAMPIPLTVTKVHTTETAFDFPNCGT